MKKLLRFLLALIVLIGLFAWLVIPRLYQPDYQVDIDLDGIDNEVVVYYDSYGIPHIDAQSKTDAWHALGYIHAKDRLFQMDLLRRAGGGQLSGLLGDDLMEVDAFFRTLGTEMIAEDSYQNIFLNSEAEWKTLSESYIEGINAFIAEGNAPLEYTLIGQKPAYFTAKDIYRVAGYMSFSFAMALKTEPVIHQMQQQVDSTYMNALSLNPEEWHEKIPVHYPTDSNSTHEGTMTVSQILEKLPSPLLKGSNAWVVGPEKSKSGKTLFANDTHIEFASPSVWYEAHIRTPESEVYGNYLGGFPFPLLGHNAHHAWGITMFENDDMDLFAEKLSEDSTQVMFQNRWISVGHKLDTIESSTGKIKIIDIQVTPHGPIINDVIGGLDQPTSVYWTYTKDAGHLIEMAYNLGESKDLEAFEKNLELLNAPGLNIMYGDADGNIGWWAAARLIKRPEGSNPKTIQCGWDGSSDPLGFYPFEVNPRSINPPSGFVYSANNQPDSTSIGWYPGYYYHGDRARQIVRLIESKDQLDIADFKAMQLDNHSPMAALNCKELLSKAEIQEERNKSLANKLLDWNNNYDLNGKEALIYTLFIHTFMEHAMRDELGQDAFDEFQNTFAYKRSIPKFVSDENNPWWDNILTDEKEGRNDIVNEALTATYEYLLANYGEESESWTWKESASLTHRHPVGENAILGALYNVGPFAVAGGEEVLNKMSYEPKASSHYEVTSGPAIRRLIDFSDYRNSENILPTGNSGNVFSPHYDDQAVMFARGQWRAQLMDWSTIQESTIQSRLR